MLANQVPIAAAKPVPSEVKEVQPAAMAIIAPEKPVRSPDNCIVCHSHICKSTGISLHASEHEHLMHVDCFISFLEKYKTCPICQKEVDKTQIEMYGNPSKAVASLLTKDSPILGANEIKDLIKLKGFGLSDMLNHMEEDFDASAYDVEKIKFIIPLLPLGTNFEDEPEAALTSTYILLAMASVAPFDEILPVNDTIWILPMVKIGRFVLGNSAKWNIAKIADALCKICLYLTGKKFITTDLWEMACFFKSSCILDLLLSHATPGCFESLTGPLEIALNDGDVQLLDRLRQIASKEKLLDSLKKLSKDLSSYCTSPEIAEWLVKNGIAADDLLSVQMILKDDRTTIATLLKLGAWPLKHFIADKSIQAEEKEKVKEVKPLPQVAKVERAMPVYTDSLFATVKSNEAKPAVVNTPVAAAKPVVEVAPSLISELSKDNSVEKLSNAIDLCLVLLGSLFCGYRKVWLKTQYVERKLDPIEFSNKIDLVSNPFIYKHACSFLAPLIQESWSSIRKIEGEILLGGDKFVRLYQFEACKKVPLLTKDNLQDAQKNRPALLHYLSALSIPVDRSDSKLLDLVREGDKDAVLAHMISQSVDYVELECAMLMVSLNGQSEMASLLSTFYYKPRDQI